jgi:hypothetical protein
MKTRLAAASVGLALAAAIFLLMWPVYTGFDGVRATRATLLQINGSWAILPLAFPVIVALLPLVLRRQAIGIIAAVLIGAFSLLAGFTVGLFYVPAAVAMLLAACVADSAKLRDAFT